MQTLNDSELRYRRLFEAAQDGILILDAKTGMIDDVNPYLIKMLGYSRTEFVKKKLWELRAFKDIEASKDAFKTLQENEYIRYEDLPLKTKDGRLVQVEFVSNVYLVGDEKVIQCNIRDNTEHKRAQDELLHRTGKLAKVGGWNLDLQTNALRWTLETYRIHEVDPATQLDVAKAINFYAPEARPVITAAIQAAIDLGTQWDLELPLITARGRRIWVRAIGESEFQDGKCVRLSGVFQDITERKRSDLFLQALNQAALLTQLAVSQNEIFIGVSGELDKVGLACAILILDESQTFLIPKHVSYNPLAMQVAEKLTGVNRSTFYVPIASVDAFRIPIVERRAIFLESMVEILQQVLPAPIKFLASQVVSLLKVPKTINVPLVVEEKVIGLFSVQAEDLRASDIPTITAFANQVAAGWLRSKSYEEKEKRAAELVVANQELLFQNEEKEKRAAELVVANQELLFQNEEKEKRAAELVLANQELVFQNEEKEKRAAELNENKALLASVLDSSLSGIMAFNSIRNAEGAITDFEWQLVNAAAEQMVSRSQTEILGKRLLEEMPGNRAEGLFDLYVQVVETGISLSHEHYYEHEQVKTWFHTVAVKRLDGFVATFSNITARKQAEKELLFQNEEKEKRAAELVIANQELLFQNEEKEKRAAELITANKELAFQNEEKEKRAAELVIANQELLFQNEEKEKRAVELITANKELLFQNAARAQAEDALRLLNAELEQRVAERTTDLNRANIELERSVRVKDEFLANMSHELRTPLTSILGLSESLEEQIVGQLNEKQQKYVHNIRESGHHLLTLINDILDLAKIEAGQITLDFNKLDIRPLCESSLRMVKELAHKKRQDIGLEIDDGLVLIWADNRRLKQMIINLLSNAVKFTPEGGRIGLEVHGYQDENKVTITVWDSGIGITESDLALLFQPFIQLDSSLARESTGTGLGLALVAQMARLHRGSVSVTSEPGKGSRFTISLPWEPALATDTVSRMKSTGKLRAMKPSENRRTILLVEDTNDEVIVIRDYLEYAGYKVETARNGIDGIAQAKKFRPDLILMDVQMPGMDGLEATQRLRGEAEFKYTPIIAVTALAMQGDRERCLAAGMDEHITKPVSLKAMLKMIQSFLANNEESQPNE